LPSPFAKGSALAGAPAAGGLGGGALPIEKALAPILDYMKATDQRAAAHTALMVQSMREVSGALTPFRMASPGEIVERGLDTYTGTQAMGAAFSRHAASDGGFVDDVARMLRVP
jgi:hypothetical protein